MYKSIILAVSALVGFTCAQSIPLCAQSCITLPAQCNSDPTCICNDKQWISDVSCCISMKCSTADQGAALAYAQSICTPVGATLPSAASCANGTTTATSSGSVSSSASAASSSASSAASSASSSASRASSSASSASSSAAAAATSKGFGNQVVIPGAGGVFGAFIGAVALL